MPRCRFVGHEQQTANLTVIPFCVAGVILCHDRLLPGVTWVGEIAVTPDYRVTAIRASG